MLTAQASTRALRRNSLRLPRGFSSDIRIGVGARAVDGKSILSLMMLAATQGTTVSLEADGADEADAIAALVALFEDGFGESP